MYVIPFNAVIKLLDSYPINLSVIMKMQAQRPVITDQHVRLFQKT